MASSPIVFENFSTSHKANILRSFIFRELNRKYLFVCLFDLKKFIQKKKTKSIDRIIIFCFCLLYVQHMFLLNLMIVKFIINSFVLFFFVFFIPTLYFRGFLHRLLLLSLNYYLDEKRNDDK